VGLELEPDVQHGELERGAVGHRDRCGRRHRGRRHRYTITLGAPITTDAIYAAIDPADVAVTNTDNDVAWDPGHADRGPHHH
jgi:hypothetical protein